PVAEHAAVADVHRDVMGTPERAAVEHAVAHERRAGDADTVADHRAGEPGAPPGPVHEVADAMVGGRVPMEVGGVRRAVRVVRVLAALAAAAGADRPPVAPLRVVDVAPVLVADPRGAEDPLARRDALRRVQADGPSERPARGLL